jgi:hypothetical protein
MITILLDFSMVMYLSAEEGLPSCRTLAFSSPCTIIVSLRPNLKCRFYACNVSDMIVECGKSGAVVDHPLGISAVSAIAIGACACQVLCRHVKICRHRTGMTILVGSLSAGRFGHTVMMEHLKLVQERTCTQV